MNASETPSGNSSLPPAPARRIPTSGPFWQMFSTQAFVSAAPSGSFTPTRPSPASLGTSQRTRSSANRSSLLRQRASHWAFDLGMQQVGKPVATRRVAGGWCPTGAVQPGKGSEPVWRTVSGHPGEYSVAALPALRLRGSRAARGLLGHCVSSAERLLHSPGSSPGA